MRELLKSCIKPRLIVNLLYNVLYNYNHAANPQQVVQYEKYTKNESLQEIPNILSLFCTPNRSSAVWTSTKTCRCQLVGRVHNKRLVSILPVTGGVHWMRELAVIIGSYVRNWQVQRVTLDLRLKKRLLDTRRADKSSSAALTTLAERRPFVFQANFSFTNAARRRDFIYMLPSAISREQETDKVQVQEDERTCYCQQETGLCFITWCLLSECRKLSPDAFASDASSSAWWKKETHWKILSSRQVL